MNKLIITFIVCCFYLGGFSQSVPTASFVTDNSKCEGKPIIFLDQSTNTPTTWSWLFPGGTPSASNDQYPSVTYNTAGTYTVKLVATNTVGASNAYTTTIVINPLPVITVNSATVCAGYQATLTASGASTFTWIPGNSTGPVFIPVVNANTNFAVTGTSSLGCRNTSTTTVYTKASPVITVNSGSICAGNPVQLNASGASTYSWSSGNTGPSITVAPALTTGYTVTASGANGCVASAVAIVTVNPYPFTTVQSTVICYGATATLTANGTNTYSWSTGVGGNVLQVSPLVTTVYSVTGTSVNGCSTTVPCTVTVGAAPSITINSPTICIGATAKLFASGVASYTWGTGANTQSISVTPTVTTIYTVFGQLSGCNGGATQTATVTVNPLPVFSVSSATICAGFQAILTASGASNYIWLPGSLSGPNYAAAPIVTSTYSVSGTSSLGCSKTVTTTITVNPSPAITVSSNLLHICAGSNTVNIYVSGTISYSWSSGQTTPNIAVSPTTTTTYTVIGTNAAGCRDTATVKIDVYPLPNVTLSAPVNSLCKSDNGIVLSGYPAGGILSGTGIVGTYFYPNVSGAGTFTPTYTYQDLHNCTNTNTMTITVNLCTGLQNLDVIPVSVYPNPTNGQVFVELPEDTEGLKIEVYDETGNLMMEVKEYDQMNGISLSSFANGMYVLRFLYNDHQLIRKIIKD